MTEWNEFRALDLNLAEGEGCAAMALVDLRNVYSPQMPPADAGLDYSSVGR